VHEAEAVVVEDLKDDIDEAANRVKESLPAKVKKIRNEVVEEVTGKKLVSGIYTNTMILRWFVYLLCVCCFFRMKSRKQRIREEKGRRH